MCSLNRTPNAKGRCGAFPPDAYVGAIRFCIRLWSVPGAVRGAVALVATTPFYQIIKSQVYCFFFQAARPGGVCDLKFKLKALPWLAPGLAVPSLEPTAASSEPSCKLW